MPTSTSAELAARMRLENSRISIDEPSAWRPFHSRYSQTKAAAPRYYGAPPHDLVLDRRRRAAALVAGDQGVQREGQEDDRHGQNHQCHQVLDERPQSRQPYQRHDNGDERVDGQEVERGEQRSVYRVAPRFLPARRRRVEEDEHERRQHGGERNEVEPGEERVVPEELAVRLLRCRRLQGRVGRAVPDEPQLGIVSRVSPGLEPARAARRLELLKGGRVCVYGRFHRQVGRRLVVGYGRLEADVDHLPSAVVAAAGARAAQILGLVQHGLLLVGALAVQAPRAVPAAADAHAAPAVSAGRVVVLLALAQGVAAAVGVGAGALVETAGGEDAPRSPEGDEVGSLAAPLFLLVLLVDVAAAAVEQRRGVLGGGGVARGKVQLSEPGGAGLVGVPGAEAAVQKRAGGISGPA